jgi:protein-S-isoprenylcysteine O-methyltransferase Ste14
MVRDPEAGTIDRGRLARMVASRFIPGILVLFAMLFLPAGTLAYWHAWVFLGVLLVPMALVVPYLMKNDPALLERRMRLREKQGEQAWFIRVSLVVIILVFLLPGLDFRFGWSHIPVPVVLLADVGVLLGYSVFILVMRANTYASRVIEVEEGQRVISTGPYAWVRHPMYTGVLLMYASMTIALGSWWAFLAFLPYPFLLAYRAVHEEALLRKELPGYEAYMQKVRYRLVPGIW